MAAGMVNSPNETRRRFGQGIWSREGEELMGYAAGPAGQHFFEIFVVSPAGTWDASLPIAGSRAGAVGLLDLTYLRDVNRATVAAGRLRELGRGALGLVLHARVDEFNRALLDRFDSWHTVLLLPDAGVHLTNLVQHFRGKTRRLGLIVCCEEEARAAAAAGFDFVVARGHEAGGRVREETTFVLLQRLIRRTELPVAAWGGVGLHTAAACRAAGAMGVALDWQLALTRESPLPERFRRRIAAMDGSETATVTGPDGTSFRLYVRPGMTAREKLQETAESLPLMENESARRRAWEDAIAALLAEPDLDARLWPVGQDAALAYSFVKRAPGESRNKEKPKGHDSPESALPAARCLARLREQVERQVRGATAVDILGRDSALAKSHGTDYPIVQGPMTRVSDVPEFIRAVADGGGLPFLALALMRQKEAGPLLEKTKTLLGNRPWGVGILGFVEREIRAEQLAEIEKVRPPFAIIAGGRPDQAASMEARGIATYLHVPSPNMLDTFLQEGARRFIFEGRECGGHVGPRSSFVLWDTMIRVLLSAQLSAEEAAKVHVLFAGGVNDALSGAMVSAMVQPLVERGMKAGVLVGTAYLFTKEIVETGAIVPGFQQVAVATDHTVLIETGPGHAIRCAETDYIRHFENEKTRLRTAGKDHEEIRDELEKANIGRLRIAAKGITRGGNGSTGRGVLENVDETRQRSEGIYMIGQVAALRRGACTVRELHADVCDGAALQLKKVAAEPRIEVLETEKVPKTLDIAIVGLSCLLPGANDARTFWRNLLANRDCVGEVPPDRFDAMRWYDADRNARDKIYSRWGGFLEDVPFDPLKYGIPPAAMKSIEPMQLLTLELVDQALRDAGYMEGKSWKAKTGVVFGVGGGVAELSAAYTFRAMLPHYIDTPNEEILSALPEWTEDSFAGILPNVVAGRVANRFDLGGPNFTVDAACASSLAAIYLACRELADGAADMMITGGCDTMQNPLSYLCFATAGALSPRGRSRAFDHTADGIVISEGLAALVLKRREDAERDGDRIYAVIRAVAGGSDGRTKAIATPCSDGQLRTLKRAYAQAGFSPATVGLYEAHGTGTSVGDAAECQSVTNLLRLQRAPMRSIAIGSAKSVVGHTKCAAGVVGLMKAALALHHRVLPPTLHVEKPNPKCGFEDGPLYVNSELRPWLRGPHPRRAGVSSFGFGGSNFHAVLEEYEGDAVPRALSAPDSSRPAELVALAAASRTELLTKVRRALTEVSRFADPGGRVALADLAYTLHRREAHGRGTCRVAFVCTSTAELVKQLSQFAEILSISRETPGTMPPGVFFCDKPMGAEGSVAFLFPGQGSQYPDMFRDLAVQFSEVAGAFELADSVQRIRDAKARPLSSYVFPPPCFSDEERSRAIRELTATEIAQPALGAAGLAAVRLLAAFGIRPAVVAGHSYGELVALAAAGAMDETSLLALSHRRAEAILGVLDDGRGADLGKMMAVRASQKLVRSELTACDGVWIANCNGPQQVVITGTTEGLAQAARIFEAKGIDATLIPVACAFHSPIMAPAKGRFAGALAETDLRAPAIPVYCNTTSGCYSENGSDVRTLLAEQLVSEVRFGDEILAMHDAGVRVFIEAGPHHVLSKLTTEILGERPHLAVALQPRGIPGTAAWLNAMATLLVHGIPVDMDRYYAGRGLNMVDFNAVENGEAKRNLWLVNGGYVRPAGSPRRLPEPVKLASPDALVSSVAEGTGVLSTTSLPSHESRITELSPQAMDEPGEPLNGVEEMGGMNRADLDVYSEFQQTMRKFLETQQTVLTAYFGSAVAATPVNTMDRMPVVAARRNETVAVATAPSVSAKMAEVSTPAAKPVEATAASLAPDAATKNIEMRPAVTADSLKDRLATIVSDRTGYPPDMLDFAANLESDLGIDSIKRVEIIGAFRRSVIPTMQEAPSWFMERMTAAKTLNEIVGGVSELVGPSTAAPPKKDESAAAPISTPPASDLDLRGRLLEIVAERTGYPADMLDMNANMEADLGIDSIKRVEIIGAFRRSVLPLMQEAPSWFMERMTAAKTLHEILEGVEQLVDGESPRPEPPPEKPARGGEAVFVDRRPGHGEPAVERTPRCVAVAVEAPLDDAREMKPVSTVLLTADGQGVSRAVESQLASLGVKVFVLSEKMLQSAESARSAVEAARREAGAIDWVIHLLPLREATAFPAIERGDWNRLVNEEVRGALFLLQALSPELSAAGEERKPFFAAATLGGGDFDSPGAKECAYPWRGGLAGLLKTAAREWPNARFRAIDFDEFPNGALPELLMRESAADGPVEVGYRDGRRLAVVPVRSEVDAGSARQSELSPEDVIVWTGGARGITAEAVQELAERTHATMILIGRSALLAEEDGDLAQAADAATLRRLLIERARGTSASGPKEIETQVRRILASREIRGTLEKLSAAGSRAEYIACDVRDAVSLESVLHDIIARYGRIDGVVHGAGIIEDKLIPDKTAESFDRVMGTKLDPVLTICRAVDLGKLKFFGLFSSVAGFFGNPGQGDYAAANEALNRVARKLQSHMTGKVVALNWGPWSGAGMVAPEVARQFESRGVGMVTVPAGRLAVREELLNAGEESVRVLLGPGPWIAEADRAAAATPAVRVRTPLLSCGRVERRPGDVLEARLTLDPARLPYLSDHRIDGKAVLPLAAATELMAELAAASQPGLEVTGIRSVRQFTGVIVEADRRDVLIRAERIAGSTDSVEYRVRITDPDQSGRMFYEAMVRLERALPTAPPAPSIDRIAKSFPHDARGAYEKWLFHGPAFQIIETLHGADNSGIDALVRPSSVRACAGAGGESAWLIDPIMLDAAPQLAILWSRAMFDTTPLPNRIRSYHRYARLGPDPIRVVFRTTEPSDGSTFRADVWFLQKDRVIGFLEGLEGAGSARLNRLAERVIR